VYYTTDPITGTDQKAQDFWDKIKEMFVTLMDNKECACKRTSSSLMARLNTKISREIHKFRAIYKRCELNRLSGDNDEGVMNKALEAWKEQSKMKKPFGYMHALEILKVLPKYTMEPRDMIKKKTNIGAVMGSTLDRPGGQTKAKAMEADRRQKELSLKHQKQLVKQGSTLIAMMEETKKIEQANSLLKAIKLFHDIGDMQRYEKAVADYDNFNNGVQNHIEDDDKNEDDKSENEDIDDDSHGDIGIEHLYDKDELDEEEIVVEAEVVADNDDVEDNDFMTAM
jgi:hypothetical protein